jgi:predicted AAA+ superfamily ATPase
VEPLAAHYASAGTGLFSRFVAFRWIRRDGAGHLEGVAHPDPVRLEDLVGYEAEREPAVRNAERFASGLPANNVLLYGDRGTGKSSTVKALLNALAPRGLRLVEIPKEALGAFPRLVALLRGRRERFLLFVDDLSFEEHETEYKALKAVLEGSLETRPDNLVLYATSNRRHLVRQRFNDRDSAADDIHPGDTVEEKLSLSDRFGLRVRFLAPDQSRYLAIARALAARHGVTLPQEELETGALRWAARHGGRSARTARQFVDHLRAEIASP